MKLFKSHGIGVWHSSEGPAPEVILYAHGGWDEGASRKTKVPDGSAVLFYTPHWISGKADAPQRLSAGTEAEHPPLKIDSIAGGRCTIWDYGLGHATNDLSANTSNPTLAEGQIYKSVLESRIKGYHQRDLALVEPNQHPRLSTLFKVFKKMGAHYSQIHYCPCRVVTDGNDADVYGPMQLADMANAKVGNGNMLQSIVDSGAISDTDHAMVKSGLIDKIRKGRASYKG